MENSSQGDIATNESRVTAKETRGPCYMSKMLTKAMKEGKFKVAFNKRGQPTGINRSKFRSYIGVVVRSRVGIEYENWRKVPKELKKAVWKDICDVFEGCETHEKSEMRAASSFWRNFRVRLAQEYLEKGLNPCPIYKFIAPASWTGFCQLRSTPEYAEKSRKASASSNANTYHHTMSRAGYVKVYEDLREKKIAAKKAEGTFQEGEEELITVERHEAWKVGHTKKKNTASGLYKNAETEQAVAKIV